MATTLYFTTTASTPISPTIHANWTSTVNSNFVRRHCDTTDAGTTSDQETIQTTTLGEQMCQLQYVSTQTLDAQTISGTFSLSTVQKVSATGATDFSYLIRVCKPDGTTRGLLYDRLSSTQGLSSSYTTMSDTGTFSSVVCTAGDYIVVELGYEVNNTGSKTFGTRAGSGSLVFDTSITFVATPTALAYTPASGSAVKNLLSGNYTASYTGGGTPTYTVDSGALPTGMSLSSTTGTISGTPTAAGVFTATIKVTNSVGNDTEPITITVGTTIGGWSLVPQL